MDAVATIMLRRHHLVLPPPSGGPVPDGAAWTATVEADLAARGWVLHRDLRAALLTARPPARDSWAGWLLAALDDLVGADRDLTPLYRSFPDTPADIETVFVNRLLTHLFAAEGAPCVLCGRDEVGAPLDPCGHPVCPSCFPPAEFSGCPICGRRLAAGSGYLTMTAERDPGAPGPALRVRVLRLDTDPEKSAIEARDRIVTRSQALGAGDREDLRTLVARTDPHDLTWLHAHPGPVPRETRALVIAWALHATALTSLHAAVVGQARECWRTATDAARTLWAYSGGDPGLILPPRTAAPAVRGVRRPQVPVTRVRALTRPLRRAVLAHLDACGVAAAEDLQRHPTVWKRIGERLHPFERVSAFPAAAVAFAALRGTRTAAESALGRAVRAAVAAHPRRLVLVDEPDGRIGVRVRSHAGEVEAALEQGDVPGAVQLLAERPGTLWRRLDHLLRAAGADPAALAAVEAGARAGVARVAPAVVATASAELAGRDRTVRVPAAPAPVGAVGEALRAAAGAAPGGAVGEALRAAGAGSAGGVLRAAAGAVARLGRRRTGAAPIAARGAAPAPGTPRRLFFPASDVGRTWTEPERRDPLPSAPIAAVRAAADAELTRRAARLGRFDLAVLDATLADVPTPLRARVSSGGLASWPRGSLRDLPAGDRLRFYLHWEDTATHRVDLDLSGVFFDAAWQRMGHCDYTRLRYHGSAAVHSGDFTSAPPPAGATEYLELYLPALRELGVRYLAPVVFSYNDVPFELLSEAFAGFALPWAGGARHFDAARVVQRFDLRGNAKALMPMVIDVEERRLLWTEHSLASRGAFHDAGGHGGQLARAAADQWEYFTARPRPTLLDLAAWHAAGRAGRVVLAFPDGGYATLPPDAEVTAEAIRALAGAPRDSAPPDAAGRTVLAAVTDADTLGGYVPGRVAQGSVALTVTGQPDEPWQAADAAGLLGALTPE
ncbi:hypothetical protein BJY16_000055 [Actinoplanes octamycinicus]|uniref:RING-type domain-containing protein n=1 Tax=Actinoplanes octamycinicus TaxID=135948 RepID=A0A7W7GQR5_9ACTN|nr:MXAN_6230/SCO0854 family RING domain-containing protein [Actinoplanes octamycinicus]MBB4736596.1 hypothetical protein [Actinoplanes octamycinicus]GIE62960.1 hypothetical protein Aoc01nite_83620 [Actinoplanes octamycinicus]